MAEGLAALGLACNIIQLIEFSCKILIDSREVYKSSAGLASRHVALEDIAKKAKGLSDNVAAQPNASSGLITLAAESKRLAQDLLDAVDKLKAKASHKKWDSFKIALKTVLKESDIKRLHADLLIVQTHLGQHLQEAVFAGQTSLSLSLKDLEQELEKVRDSTGEIRSLTQGMADSLQKLDIGLSDGKRILESLYFAQIPKRLSDVPHAHRETFTWVFDTSHSESPFARWASGDSTQPFWVQGKPGSGKSTLMKLICGHEKTHKALETWADGNRFIVSSYFFWNAGNKRQKSLEGLLRALLFEVMTQCPDVIEVACGKAASLPPSADPWPMTDLLPALEKMLNALEAGTCKLCFFIDGLDEFDGEPDALIDILDRMSHRSNLKLCISSRPWTSFRDRYGDDPTHHLNLENLTENDIQDYVRDKFEGNVLYRERASKSPGFKDVVEQIPKRAHGVFLWVYLVVRSLMDGLRYRDRASDFQRRLDSFPKTLEGFFQRMLDTTEPTYKQQTARTFKVALTAEEPLDLILYSFMDEIEDDPLWALNCAAVEYSKDKISEVHEAMRPRLDARCKGLLEIRKQSYLQGPADISFKQYNVEFLHRTARDFLINSPDVSAMFERELGDDFDPLVVLGGSFLASMKKARMDPPEWKSQQHLLETANQLIVYATRVLQLGHDTSAKNKSEWFAILTNLHATISNRSTHLSSVKGIEELFEIVRLGQFCQDEA